MFDIYLSAINIRFCTLHIISYGFSFHFTKNSLLYLTISCRECREKFNKHYYFDVTAFIYKFQWIACVRMYVIVIVLYLSILTTFSFTMSGAAPCVQIQQLTYQQPLNKLGNIHSQIVFFWFWKKNKKGTSRYRFLRIRERLQRC